MGLLAVRSFSAVADRGRRTSTSSRAVVLKAREIAASWATPFSVHASGIVATFIASVLQLPLPSLIIAERAQYMSSSFSLREGEARSRR